MKGEALHVRHGFGTVRPYVYGHLGLEEFLKHAFGAVELERQEMGPGSFHIEVRIRDSVVVLETGEPLKPGERWTYEPPGGHTAAWVAVADGALSGGDRLSSGELVIFEPGEASITLEGAEGTRATFVLGSAVPHPYGLHLGAYSVHTSAEALATGERHLRELKARLDARGDRRTASGSTPVFRG